MAARTSSVVKAVWVAPSSADMLHVCGCECQQGQQAFQLPSFACITQCSRRRDRKWPFDSYSSRSSEASVCEAASFDQCASLSPATQSPASGHVGCGLHFCAVHDRGEPITISTLFGVCGVCTARVLREVLLQTAAEIGVVPPRNRKQTWRPLAPVAV